MASKNKEAITHLITRGVEEVYPSKEKLEERLLTGKKMRLYIGIDPTSPTLHIGHAIGLKKMREFQDLGHEVILLIGSFTAMIGDPTDKSATRVQLTQKQVLKNATDYKKQASKILDFKGKNPAKLMFNHKWLGKMSFGDVVELASHFTVQQMSERDMFEKRIKTGKPVYLHEFLYPLMQGYDSVAMDVEAEIGGSDQMFNMLAGRTLLRQIKNKEKFVITMKLLTNGEGKKMSKTESGFIAINDTPEEMYGKIMAMDDGMILPYFELVTNYSQEEIAGMKIRLKKGLNPRDLKMELAKVIVRMYHNEKKAEQAEENFKQIFQKKELPVDMLEYKVGQAKNIVNVLVDSGLVSSKSEARRMVEQGAVKLDGNKVDSIKLLVQGTEVLQKGKRGFVKLIK